jgi:hypothetical protein
MSTIAKHSPSSHTDKEIQDTHRKGREEIANPRLLKGLFEKATSSTTILPDSRPLCFPNLLFLSRRYLLVAYPSGAWGRTLVHRSADMFHTSCTDSSSKADSGTKVRSKYDTSNAILIKFES